MYCAAASPAGGLQSVMGYHFVAGWFHGMRTGGSPIKMHINGPFQETFQKNQDDSSNLQQWIGTDHLELEGCCVVVGKNLRTSRVTERCNKVKKEPSQSSGHLNIHQDEHRQSYLVFPRRKSLRGPGPYECF